jgi:hypothetical protein
MRDLAPGITRQRLLLEGFYSIDVYNDVVRKFLTELPKALGLRTYGEPTIFAPGTLGREQNEGFDAFIPLIDSGVSLYVWTAERFLALVVFTCKAFDALQAESFTRQFFAMTEAESQQF